MFRNYLVTALRAMARHKLYSFINIAGLAVGLACAILIMLFVRDELSYDKWIPNSENLWRLEVTYHVPGRSDPIFTAQTPMPIPPAMHDQIPEVRSATRLVREDMTLTAGDRQFSEKVGVVDPNFLQMIALPLKTWSSPRPRRANISAMPIRSARRSAPGAAAATGIRPAPTRWSCSRWWA
jgi:putative ABC transport system permease protein